MSNDPNVPDWLQSDKKKNNTNNGNGLKDNTKSWLTPMNNTTTKDDQYVDSLGGATNDGPTITVNLYDEEKNMNMNNTSMKKKSPTVVVAGVKNWFSSLSTKNVNNNSNGTTTEENNPTTMEMTSSITNRNRNSSSNNDNTTSMAPSTRSTKMAALLKGDRRFVLVTLCILVLMNLPFFRWIVYPFTLFSTYIHEVCHGMAAVVMGGKISKLLIFADTSGLAYTQLSNSNRYKRAFVSSAGYQGTAVIGFLLLLVRRTKLGPRLGSTILACWMVLSVVLWIRNAFGIISILAMGVALGVAAWMLPSAHIRNLYVSIAVTCSLNAITSVTHLFGGSYTVGGDETPNGTDAHTMEELLGGVPYYIWALLWLALALLMTFLGFIWALPGIEDDGQMGHPMYLPSCCTDCCCRPLSKLCNYQKEQDRTTGTEDDDL